MGRTVRWKTPQFPVGRRGIQVRQPKVTRTIHCRQPPWETTARAPRSHPPGP
ncbi:MAG: hypothetical protein MZV70_22345 [Desulfobacterales bacterium]|nr:hypothetical protein [Desulfobacterales bacterium]